MQKYNHWLPKLLKVNGIVLFKTIYYRQKSIYVSDRLRWHEEKHVEQQEKEGSLIFKVKYVYEFVVNYIRYRKFWQAYRNISFEIEARQAEKSH